MFEFLFLGNLMMEKGVLVLLDACAELRRREADFVCHFVGAASKDISMAQMEEYVVERQLQNVVRVHGPLYGEDKENMLQQVGASDGSVEAITAAVEQYVNQANGK